MRSERSRWFVRLEKFVEIVGHSRFKINLSHQRIKQSNTVKALVAKSRDLVFYPVFNW